MEEQVRFLAYCAEIYREEKNMTGKQLYELFHKHGIWEYIFDSFDFLRTTGAEYTVEDIDRYISAQL